MTPPPAPAPLAAAPSLVPPPTPEAPAAVERGDLDEFPEYQHLRALGLTEDDLEPLDGGVLHKLDRDGIKGAVAEKLPEIKECYESWLQQNPALMGKVKVEFRILEIPGRDRGKVMGVTIADGGMGHVAMEGCVGNVFKTMRFEAPRGGELRVTFPISFSNDGKERAPPP
jgi:hypothetical protein